MKTPWVIIIWLSLCLETSAHGRSEKLIRELNSPVPDWMSPAEPIKAEPAEAQSLTSSLSFRQRPGGATNSRNRVRIPERGIEFQLPHPIDWRGVNEEGYGVSLHPDGTKFLANSGMTTRLYEISLGEELREIPLQLPHVTYDEGLKGWILGWSWAGDHLLVGRAEITDEAGHEILEGRLYVFYLKERALARLDLSSLDLPDNAGIEVVGIGDDLGHLRIRSGGRDWAVKADLKSPPRLVAKAASGPTPETPSTTLPGERPSSSTLWLVLALAILAAIGLVWLLLKKRK
jgi:hypothetical protein